MIQFRAQFFSSRKIVTLFSYADKVCISLAKWEHVLIYDSRLMRQMKARMWQTICDLLLHKRTSTYWKRIQLRKKKHTLRREKECEKVAEQKTIYTLMDRFGYRLWAEGSVQRVCSMYVCAKKERKEKKKTDFTSRFVILLRSDGRRERAMHAMRQWQDERKIPANMTLRNSWLLKIIEYTIAKTSNSVLVLIGAFKFSYSIEYLWEPRDKLVQLDSRTYDWLIVRLFWMFWICFAKLFLLNLLIIIIRRWKLSLLNLGKMYLHDHIFLYNRPPHSFTPCEWR